MNTLTKDELIDQLSSFNGSDNNEKIEAIKSIVSAFEFFRAEKLEDYASLNILQFVLGLSSESNHDIRYYATEALILMLNKDNKNPILKRLISLMDFDSAYIKSVILKASNKIKNLDLESYKAIRDKAAVDNHYYIANYKL